MHLRLFVVVLLVALAGAVGYILGHANSGGSTTVIRTAEEAPARSGNPFSEALREGAKENPFNR